jgi:hypothetical protein
MGDTTDSINAFVELVDCWKKPKVDGEQTFTKI